MLLLGMSILYQCVLLLGLASTGLGSLAVPQSVTLSTSVACLVFVASQLECIYTNE